MVSEEFNYIIPVAKNIPRFLSFWATFRPKF